VLFIHRKPLISKTRVPIKLGKVKPNYVAQSGVDELKRADKGAAVKATVPVTP